jgi:hypothetical protein
MSTEHTPVPWTFRVGPSGDLIIEQESEELLPPMIAKVSRWLADAPEEAKANAAFIVRACNSHEALVDALEAMLSTALKCNDREWADAIDRSGTTRPCDLARLALSKANPS